MPMIREKIFAFLNQLDLAKHIKNLEIKDEHLKIQLVSPNAALNHKEKIKAQLIDTCLKKFPNLKQVEVSFVTAPVADKVDQNKTLKNVKHVLSVASGKGGVGKSTVTTNLGISLSKMGYKVGILDADVYGPSIPTMFHSEDQKPNSISINGKKWIEPVEKYGIKLLSIGFFIDSSDQAVVWRGAMASKAIHQLIYDANWGDLDFLLIDLPPGTGDIPLSIVQEISVTGSIIVGTPQKISVNDVKKSISMFEIPEINVPILGLIENMSYYIPKGSKETIYPFGRAGILELSEKLKLPFLGEIPLLEELRESCDLGVPCSLDLESVSSKFYRKICLNLITNLEKRIAELPPSKAVEITTMKGCPTK